MLNWMIILFFLVLVIIIGVYLAYPIFYNSVKRQTLDILGSDTFLFEEPDYVVNCKSSKAVDSYDYIKFFKENRDYLNIARNVLIKKRDYYNTLSNFLNDNPLKKKIGYKKVEQHILDLMSTLNSYNVSVFYRSPAGKSTNNNTLCITQAIIDKLSKNPSLIMSKTEYNKYVKEQQKDYLDRKKSSFYKRINKIIDLANEFRDSFIIKGDKEELDRQISFLFEKTVKNIDKIKSIDSPEWDVINNVISTTEENIHNIISRNKQILDYYDSDNFKGIKNLCSTIMDSQKEFNEYINEKALSLSKLFGVRVVRDETQDNSEYNYIRPYRKTLTPFTAEVSQNVFSSAENSPLEYIVKYFYTDKSLYPEQIQKLQFLVEELETLSDAKEIIESYKKDYQQYLTEVPDYIMNNDKNGFYARLGFADISEEALTVEYKFSYTSNGGFIQKSFVVPMTEENVSRLIEMLQSKLSMSSFAKEQRSLMTKKMREHIKVRDNYTCKLCGNSVYNEPNLLLEIDHIIPVAKGGCTVEDNLQTLCWKCNRQKSSKII